MENQALSREKLLEIEAIVKKSKLTKDDVDEISDLINSSVAKKLEIK